MNTPPWGGAEDASMVISLPGPAFAPDSRRFHGAVGPQME